MASSYQVTRLLKMKFFAFTMLCGLVFITGLRFSDASIPERKNAFSKKTIKFNTLVSDSKLQQKTVDAEKFIRQKKFNNQVCFLIDMSLPSGKKRFFIYSFLKDSVIDRALVAHGNCFQYWLDGRRYSNAVGSGCTSLGKYKIGNSYTGKFGLSFKLHGLDSSNSNAFERTVVLHKYSEVPDHEVEDEICQSNGCPMVAPGFFQKLNLMITRSKQPILLWIYD